MKWGEEKLFATLAYIGEKLNNSNIVWGVGASLLLNRFGFIEKPNDIDIFVDIKDIDKADKILKGLGEKRQWEKTDTYSTRYFYEYAINGIDVDIMAGFRVNHNSGIFEYIFDHNSISEFNKINGIDIPYTSLEDWYVIYQLIPNREEKVRMVENHIMSGGINRRDLLERVLEGNLPIEVRERIRKMLTI